MSLRRNCPCDIDGICPYEAEYSSTCEYWCGQDEPEYDPYNDPEYKEEETEMENRNETKTFEFYWQDLTPECQERLKAFLGGENGNYDVFPFATLEIATDLD